MLATYSRLANTMLGCWVLLLLMCVFLIIIIISVRIFVWRSAVHPALWSSQLLALLRQGANRYSGATVVLCILYDVAAAASCVV